MKNADQEVIKSPGISEARLEELYADMLDETNPPFRCAETEYAASATLKIVDEVAYHLGLTEFIARHWIAHPARPGYYLSKPNRTLSSEALVQPHSGGPRGV